MKERIVSTFCLSAVLACAVWLGPGAARGGEPAKPPADRRRAEPRRRAEEHRKQLERARQAWLDRLHELGERERTRPRSVHEKNHGAIRRAFRPAIAQANKSTATILCDKKPAALGAIVDADGLILTKASELRGAIACKLPGGKTHKAKVVGVSDPHDLALLKIDARGLKPLVWSDQPVAVGSFVATPDGRPDPAAIGVISVAARPLKARGFLGIGFQGGGTAPRVGHVMPGGAAAKGGLKTGDVIEQIDGKPIKTRDDVIKTIGGHAPGDTVELRVRRGGEEKAITATLGSRRLAPRRQGRLDMMNLTGGPLSERRSDFASAVQHDTLLLPSQCGGPLVGLDGKVVGINVARAGRVESYAIPADVAIALLADLRSGKLAPGRRFEMDMKLRAIDKGIAEQERLLRKAQRDKADAERRIKRATAAIEKANAAKAKLEAKPPAPAQKPKPSPQPAAKPPEK